ncbi:iron complex transport system permease protein [Terracoccus luteus]|uniref:Iron complex transport system permease protein n=1 Tax=Terracoccus luteus TaxID=53356 RepID=A0A495XX07_9MICO|nr:iron chelate uptake ABC transporter family permease subunit [Terracoccus luteus]RKT77023.1 iron complex transport system permease protein [Terracoccus luteus]
MSAPAATSASPATVLAPDGAAQDAVRLVAHARRRPLRRVRAVVAGLAVLAVAALLARTLLGEYTVTVVDFVRILRGETIEGAPGASFIVMEAKLPRAVLGALAGAAFGAAGAMFQTTLRNPLASPDIIGVSLGASAAAVLALTFFDAQGLVLPLVALLGAVGVSLVMYLVSRGTSLAGQRMVLVGIGIAALLSSVIQFVMTRATIQDAQASLVWLTGSLSRATWPVIGLLAVGLLMLLPVLAALVPRMRAAELGDDLSTTLGAPAAGARLGLVVAVAFAAFATAATGPIAFVAFLSGPIAKRLTGGRTSLWAAALVGSVIVIAGDFLGSYLIPDVNLPVGVITGALGAPLMIVAVIAAGRHGKA